MISDENCLCSRPSGVMFIEIMGQRVGLSGVEDFFNRWRTTDREPSDLSNKEIRTGPESEGHLTGQAFKALPTNGVAEKKRITGTDAPHPLLFNLPTEFVERCQQGGRCR